MLNFFRLFSFLFLLPCAALAQGTLDVTFRFLPDLTVPAIAPVERAFLPGSFNDWGPNTDGRISTGAPSQMDYVAAEDEYRYTVPLAIGEEYFYKVHYHRDEDGIDYEWITDPLASEPCTFGGFGSDCRVEVRDPMLFQLAREQNSAGQVFAFSASLFGTEAFTDLQFQINDGPLQNGLASYDDESNLFRVELLEPVAAPGYLRVVATDALGRTVEAEAGILAGGIVDKPRPAGLQDGITYVDDGTVRLSLFAPFKDFVHVVGDFNGWTADTESLLFRDADGDPATADSVWWWTELKLPPGEPAVFQYLIDGELRIADPYSALVLTPDDRFIEEDTYPNLPPYPAEAGGRPATLLRPGLDPYDWQVDDFERPAQKDLVIYELLVRDFIAAHDYDTLADTLDYLDRLGVNAIELMPVAEFGGNLNWGYQPQFHLALDKYYGPPEQFKAFVDAAHARGIAVILDVVYNHADSPSPLVDLYGCTEASLYTNNPPRHPFNVFCDLDHTAPAVQHWLDRANRWWLEEYRVDGFRFDLSKGFMQTGPWDGYNPERIGLLTRMADQLWAVDDQALIVLEHLNPSAQENLELATYRRDEGLPGMMLWHNMNRAYNESTMGYLNADSDLGDTYPPAWISGMPLSGAVTYMESHDEQWMMFRNVTFGNSAGAYDVKDLGAALDRQKLAGAFFFTVPGARMLWQFGEVGYGAGSRECLKPGDGTNGDCPASAPGRTGPKPIRWEYADDPVRRNLYQTWAALINLRRDYEIFTSPDTQVSLEVGAGDASRSITLTLDDAPDGEPSGVVIVGNFGLVARDISQAFPSSGTWYEFFTDTERELSGTNTSVVLDPGFARIFTDVDVPSPEIDIYTVDGEDGPAAPLAFGLGSVWPNPFAESATVAYSLAAPGAVRLEVYDVLGRRVAVLADRPMPAGAHHATLDGASLADGTYLVRLTAGGRTATARLTLLR